MESYNPMRRYSYKEAEVLWRCLGCGCLYNRVNEMGAHCPKCSPLKKIIDKVPVGKHQDQVLQP